MNSSAIVNLALITGAGSLWTNADMLTIGFGGPGCQVVVSNGGALRSRIGAISSQVSGGVALAR